MMICIFFFFLQSELGYGKMSSYTKLDKLGEVRLDLLNLLTLLANSSLMAKFFSIKISRVDNFYHRMPHCLELGTSLTP